jgi:DNA helicase II / ATP-dependent DNA helicase PcrA
VEEERRLFYVALTRARNALNVYFPLRYHRRPRGLDDAHGYGQLTRFLPPEVREAFDRPEGEPAPAELRAREAPITVPAVDAFLDDLWSA